MLQEREPQSSNDERASFARYQNYSRDDEDALKAIDRSLVN